MKLKALVLLSVLGCASLNQIHGEVVVNGPTAIVSGPARGHWAEESETFVTVFTVYGDDCNALVPGNEQTDGRFNLVQGETLCVRPLKDGQIVLFHGEKL